MSDRALILIDIQNDYFPGGKWELANMNEAAGNARQALDVARTNGDVIVHIRHENTMEGAPFFARGTQGAETHDTVKPRPEEAVVVKHHANSFRETGLKELLDGHGVAQLVVCGAMSQMCVDATVRAAADLGYDCTVIHDACAARATEHAGVNVPAQQVHAAFMASLGFGYAALISTQAFIAASDEDG